jgi:hypothetical protein
MRVGVRAIFVGEPRLTDGFADPVVQGCKRALGAAAHVEVRLYRDLLKREMELFAEDGKAYQQQVLRAGARLSAPPEAPQTDERRG